MTYYARDEEETRRIEAAQEKALDYADRAYEHIPEGEYHLLVDRIEQLNCVREEEVDRGEGDPIPSGVIDLRRHVARHIKPHLPSRTDGED